ncbi:hypothetical protein MPER_12355 [Moniliophthora perniciosa FA553]|nr:hypothetical protein MPER_12355 [Moniliophthora perniciosa FA553]
MKTSISWLVQAHSVFGQLGIHEEEWEGYSISTHLALELHSTEENACKQESTDTTSKTPTVYLFVQPIPRPSDDEMIWRSWAESAKYFWSVDHLGKEEMPESTRISLGIPSYRAKIEVWHQSWDVNAYKAIEKLHSSKGFDPKTTDFARSLGHPLMQVVGDEDRFEHLEDSTSSATIADILDSYNRDGLGADDPCPTTSEAPDPDEIVLYPRQRQ